MLSALPPSSPLMRPSSKRMPHCLYPCIWPLRLPGQHGMRLPTCTPLASAGCPICLDSSLEVAATPCGHGLCLECAQHLSAEDCVPAAATPPLCPLCRGVMSGFCSLA